MTLCYFPCATQATFFYLRRKGKKFQNKTMVTGDDYAVHVVKGLVHSSSHNGVLVSDSLPMNTISYAEEIE